MDNNVVCYDSGFVGFMTPQTIVENKQLNIDKVISSIKLNKKNISMEKQSIYNQETMDLVNLYETNTKLNTDIKFICDLVECSLRAFDSKLFNTWLNLQLHNPKMSDMHVRFIEDCFAFLANGIRSINILSWSRMLDGTHTDSTNNNKKLDLVKLLGPGSFNQLSPTTLKTSDLIIMWMSKPNGVEDLVYTLRVIFGKA